MDVVQRFQTKDGRVFEAVGDALAHEDAADRAKVVEDKVTYWRYRVVAEQNQVTVLIGSDNRVAVWGTYGHYAAFWSSPGECIRGFFAECCLKDPGYMLKSMAPSAESNRHRQRECNALVTFIAKYITPLIERDLAAEAAAAPAPAPVSEAS